MPAMPQAPAAPAPQPVMQQPVAPVQAQPAPVAPVAPAPAPVAQTVAAAVAPTEVSGDAKYKLPGKRVNVTASEFQQALNEYGEKGREVKLDKHIFPLKAGVKDYEGIQVFNCFGSYRTDEFCIKCPLRKNCIIFKG
jgi:hypothetical protein